MAVGNQYVVRCEGYGKTTQIFERVSNFGNYYTFCYGGVWNLHELDSGDYFFNKANDTLYLYNGTDFVAVNSCGDKIISPVLDIVGTGTSLPDTAAVGDKFLLTHDATINEASSVNNWDTDEDTNAGDRYASSTDHKIYTSDGNGNVTATDIPDGGMFLNKLNNCIYVYDAKSSAFRNTDTSVPENNIFAVVNDIEYQSENAKNGYVYASLNASIICKIYQAGNEITEIPDGSGILNRHDNCIYIFDANNKKFKKVISEEDDSTINTGNNTVTETHVLTEYEANDCGFNLNYNVASGAEGSTLLSLNGMFMIFGVDYTISEQHTVTWRGWDGNIGYHIYRLYKRKLKAGDIFTVQYTKE